MQTSVATLLLVTAAVMFACVVVNYGVAVVEQTLNTNNNPQIEHIKIFENNILNQTNELFNETQPQLPSLPPP